MQQTYLPTKNYTIKRWSITVALGGLLFGFDTAVISGAEQAIQNHWNLGEFMVGQVVAMGLYGTIIGALLGGMPAERWGRKPALFWVGVLYSVCSIGCAFAPSVGLLMFFRFLGGLGVGASSVIAPAYISEISPADLRGRLTAMFQFNIVFGILLAYLSNWAISLSGPHSWRVMLGVMAIPSAVFVMLVPTVPESPRWLILHKNRVADARKILEAINPATVESSVAAIQAPTSHKVVGFRHFLSGKYNFSIFMAFLLAFFNQLSGINAIIYYAPRIFAGIGLQQSAALLSTVGIGIVNLIFTIFGMALIDRFGRRFLMYVGSVGYIVSLVCVSYALLNAISGWFVPMCLFVFIASHAIGQGAVIWVFLAEVFPNNVRAYGTSLGCSTHWIFAALIAGLFPFVNAKFGGGAIFGFFAGMMVLQLIFVWRWMPETFGASLEELEARFAR
jgi:MFS transporter, SP family, arabinose:H+ symporter